MANTYVKETNPFGEEIIIRTDENGIISFIPIHEANSDYQAYLNKDKPQTPMVIDETPAK